MSYLYLSNQVINDEFTCVQTALILEASMFEKKNLMEKHKIHFVVDYMLDLNPVSDFFTGATLGS